MNVCILMGSPHLAGNTAELCKPFMQELAQNNITTDYVTIADKKIAPCKGCYACQQVSGEYGCPTQDDMQMIVDRIQKADIIVFATPIYIWYCPSQMKAVLDRFYGMNKYYGKGKGSLWQEKRVALITTHGYDAQYGAEPFETGIRRFCEHARLEYLGMYSVRDLDDLASFKTEEAVSGARNFARSLIK